VPRLPHLARFVQKNLPFVEQVASAAGVVMLLAIAGLAGIVRAIQLGRF